MIGYLRGAAVDTTTVDVHGVGYHVNTPAPLALGEDVTLWVHTAVRENDISLYGFTEKTHRTLFTHLIKAPGIGPRVALNLMGLGADVLSTAIRDGDARALAQAPGIGIKSATKLLQALNLPDDLLEQLAGAPDPTTTVAGDVVTSLVAMGIDRSRAQGAVQAAQDANPDAAAPVLLRTALRSLA